MTGVQTCALPIYYAQVSYMLSSEVLNRIAQLDIRLEISILSWGGVENRKKKKRKGKRGKKKNN